MIDFDRWLSRQSAAKPVAEPEEELPDGLIDDTDGRYFVKRCWSCGRAFEWLGDSPLEYDPNARESNVCGGSASCLP